METAKSLFMSIDYLGSGVHLRVEGRSSLKTRVGAMLSILTSCLVFGATVLLALDYTNTEQPKVNIEESRALKHPRVDMVKSRILPVLFLYLDDVTNLNFEESRKYMTITFMQAEFPTDEFGNAQLKVTNFPFKQCKELYDAGKLIEEQLSQDPTERQNIINFGLCPDIYGQDIKLKGKGGERELALTRFFIHPCTLTDGSCKPASDIPRLGFYLNEYMPAMNLSNYDTPITYYFNSVRYTYLNPSLGQRRVRTTKRTQIYDWRGFLSQPLLRMQHDSIDNDDFDATYRESTQTTCLPSELFSPTCRPYWMVDTISGGSNIAITRSYRGIIETLGNIGGLFKFVVFFFEVVYFYYYRRALSRFLVQKVFHLDEKNLPPMWSPLSLCKSKKKSTLTQISPEQNKLNLSKMADTAEKIIWNSLDVSNLIKETNTLNVITKLLLENTPEKQIAKLALCLGGIQSTSPAQFQVSNQAKTNILDKQSSNDKPIENHEIQDNAQRLEENIINKPIINRKESLMQGMLQVLDRRSDPFVLELQPPDSKPNLRNQLSDLFNELNTKAITSSPFYIEPSPPGQQHFTPDLSPSINDYSNIVTRVKKPIRVMNIRKVKINEHLDGKDEHEK